METVDLDERRRVSDVFDVVESLRLRRWFVGVDPDADRDLAARLAVVSHDADLRDALCAKLIEPGLERLRFEYIARRDPRAPRLLLDNQRRPWYQSSYNVREMVSREFHQDVPWLLASLSDVAGGDVDRVGLLEAAAYLSFMQDDPLPALQGYLSRLGKIAPDSVMASSVHSAVSASVFPAYVMESQVERAAQVLPDDAVMVDGARRDGAPVR
ncbi:MAG: hypothetical protein LKI21_07545 [Bifidobacterium crudilactis]|jgi:hypothetical protein|nr:hypothetical protein [Bifidobacterium crudilactis]